MPVWGWIVGAFLLLKGNMGGTTPAQVQAVNNPPPPTSNGADAGTAAKIVASSLDIITQLLRSAEKK